MKNVGFSERGIQWFFFFFFFFLGGGGGGGSYLKSVNV